MTSQTSLSVIGQNERKPPFTPSLPSILGNLRVKQLVLLKAVEEFGSVQKAAEQLSLTQPAATKALHQLEQTLGATLFERSAKGMQATSFGRCVLRYAKIVLSDIGNLRDELLAMQTGRGMTLTIGIVMEAVPVVLTRALTEMQALQPNLYIRVVEDNSIRLLQQLDDGELDVVIGRASAARTPSQYRFVPLHDQPVTVVAGLDHPLRNEENISLEDLSLQTWLSYSAQSPMSKAIDSAFKQAGVDLPRYRIETSSSLITVAMLNSSEMVAGLPTDVAELFSKKNMLTILNTQLQAYSEPFGMICRCGAHISPGAKMLKSVLKGYAQFGLDGVAEVGQS
jgi:DNA-binding transcriptional LysR family regulator